MNKNSRIYIAGHTGLLGSAILRLLQKQALTNLITRSFSDLDLRNQAAVHTFFAQQRPEYVFLAAAKVGGILANMMQPGAFIYDNLMIEANVIHAAYRYGVTKLLFFGSSCIYPRDCPQPIKEEYLLTGSLEETNAPYALAKIAGIQLCQAYNRHYGTNFISCMPTNLYGSFDNFDVETSHVLPALIAKMYQAKKNNDEMVAIWGNGTARREFLYADDCADAALFLMKEYASNEIINCGMGIDCTIAELAELIKEVVGYSGELVFDTTKPDGTHRKLLDVSKINALGWRARTSLREGITLTLQWYIKNSNFVQKEKECALSI